MLISFARSGLTRVPFFLLRVLPEGIHRCLFLISKTAIPRAIGKASRGAYLVGESVELCSAEVTIRERLSAIRGETGLGWLSALARETTARIFRPMVRVVAR
jgi:hypothetical protein